MNKDKKINNFMNNLITIILEGIFLLAKMICFLLVLLGITSACMLYYRLYPIEANQLIRLFRPYFTLPFKILGILFFVFLIAVPSQVIYKIIKKGLVKSKERMEKKRKEFIKDIVKEIKIKK